MENSSGKGCFPGQLSGKGHEGSPPPTSVRRAGLGPQPRKTKWA